MLVFLAITGAGILTAFLKDKNWSYRTSIEIGSIPSQQGSQKIESPESVLAKVTENYVPRVTADFVDEHPKLGGQIVITARSPRESGLIVIEGLGKRSLEDHYLQLIKQIVTLLKNDHRQITETVRAELSAKVQQNKVPLLVLENEKNRVIAQAGRIDTLNALISSHIEQLRKRIAEAQLRYEAAERDVSNEATAMTMLLIANEISTDREHLEELEERLEVDQKDAKDLYMKQISDADAGIEAQKSVVEAAQNKLDNFQDTRTVIPPMRLPQPVGPRRAVLAAISIIIGLMIAIFAVAIIEFIKKTRPQ